MLYGPEKGVRTDITTVGQFGPGAVLLAEPWLYSGALGGHCHPLGDPWRPLATLGDTQQRVQIPILFYITLPSRMTQPMRCVTGARLQTAKIIKAKSSGFPLYQTPTFASTMTRSTWRTYVLVA